MTDNRAGATAWRDPTPTQQRAARWVGAILVVAMATSMVAELVLLRGIGGGDPAVMAHNVLDREAAYRLGAVIHLLTFASDAAMAAALFVALAPVHRGLALLGAILRAVDCAILALSMAMPFAIMRLVGGGATTTFIPVAEAQGLARWLYGVQSDVTRVGWVFLGLGSAVFALVWARSRYVPRVLALYGLAASLLLALGPVANMLAPGAIPGMAYMTPMFFYEVPLGLWLLFRGLKAGR